VLVEFPSLPFRKFALAGTAIFKKFVRYVSWRGGWIT